MFSCRTVQFAGEPPPMPPMPPPVPPMPAVPPMPPIPPVPPTPVPPVPPPVALELELALAVELTAELVDDVALVEPPLPLGSVSLEQAKPTEHETKSITIRFILPPRIKPPHPTLSRLEGHVRLSLGIEARSRIEVGLHHLGLVEEPDDTSFCIG